MTWRKCSGGLICLVMTGILSEAAAQIKWDGEAGDGIWSNPVNWVGNILPSPADRVVLDNSMVSTSYEVLIASGGAAITVEQIMIFPSSENSISLVIAPENLLSPALICRGEGYGLELGSGAIFRNSSGASSGAPFETADSIRINDGARFIHNTPRSHAANVRALSRAPGTENGEFEFRIPVASSTISISGQMFGRLKLSPGPNGTINYTGTGTNDLTIRGDLEIVAGVNLNFNLEGQVLVSGDFIQRGGTCNLSTTARQLDMHIGGNLTQAPDAIITESGTARPLLQLIGPSVQNLHVEGKIENDVILEVNNLSGLLLTTDLRITNVLKMVKGNIRTGSNMVVLGSTASMESPGPLQESFVEGKLKKEGLISGDFVFPVGKNGVVRWIGVRHATGNFLMEFIRSDPREIESGLEEGLAHISGLEYWRIDAEGEQSSAMVELSFDDVNSGGVTALDQLRVAHLYLGSWRNGGNTATTGSAGGGGSVTSMVIDNFSGNGARYFTLASSQASQNPLPVIWNWFRASNRAGDVLLEWSVQDGDTDHYKIERSSNGIQFETIGQVQAVPGKQIFEYRDRRADGPNFYYRVAGLNGTGEKNYTNIVAIRLAEEQSRQTPVVHIREGGAKILLPSPKPGVYGVTFYDIGGRMLSGGRSQAAGNQIQIELSLLIRAVSIVIVHIVDPEGKQFVTRALVR